MDMYNKQPNLLDFEWQPSYCAERRSVKLDLERLLLDRYMQGRAKYKKNKEGNLCNLRNTA